MNIKNIDEAQSLIQEYRMILSAADKINQIDADHGGRSDKFTLIDKDSHIEIPLHNLKSDVIESINAVLDRNIYELKQKLKEM